MQVRGEKKKKRDERGETNTEKGWKKMRGKERKEIIREKRKQDKK